MVHRIAAISILLGLIPMAGHAQTPPPDVQIAAALHAAPSDLRSDATVLGFSPSGELVRLRDGTGELICLADAPGDEAFSVACYHASLDPYMARGRELRASGITDGAELNRIRWEEADAGTLAMPETPASLYVLAGSGYDPATDTVTDGFLRWNVYTPWATPESTGLSTQPVTGGPWLMFPGTAGAHIMIVPPRG